MIMLIGADIANLEKYASPDALYSDLLKFPYWESEEEILKFFDDCRQTKYLNDDQRKYLGALESIMDKWSRPSKRRKETYEIDHWAL